ncbi:MAG TPA: hypothetical protein VFN67_01475 [Polyangiales bacterium]|nr:hypothetical protein [Polyangiales bacterium]
METRKHRSRATLWTCLILSACASETDSDESNKNEPAASEAEATSTAKKSENSADEAESADAKESAKTALPKLDATTPLSELPKECVGFEVKGLTESPGGSVLPNKCAPFDGTRNNPYAIRCIDADPSYKTDYAGDEFCILPPKAELGTQVHVGPADMAKPGTFKLGSGEEENTMYWVNSHNDEDHYYYRTNWRMRPGSHHMIINISDDDHADGWAADLEGAGADARNVGATGFDTSGKSRGFGGSQRPDLDRPQSVLEVPPENVGIGALLKANQQFSFNLHHLNTSDHPVLREAWVNVWYMDKAEVTKEMRGLAASGSPKDVAIPAKQRTVLKYRCDVEADSRIITMNGHRHAHTDRFSVWVKKKSGEEIRAYESFNWEDMPTFQYDSISTNPMANVDKHVDGASSGMLEVSEGDEVHFLCDINNTLDVPLKFANEAIDGEMCILFGSYIGEKSPCSGGAQRVTE